MRERNRRAEEILKLGRKMVRALRRKEIQKKKIELQVRYGEIQQQSKLSKQSYVIHSETETDSVSDRDILI